MEGLIFINEHLHSSDFVNNLFRLITFLGDSGLIWIVMACFMLFFKKARMCGLVLIISLGIGYIFNDFILKVLISRPRPFAVNQEIYNFILDLGMKFPRGTSFPSGHAFSSFNCAVIIFCFNKKSGVAALVLAFLIAFSRIFLCVHYPTDVLAGSVIGVIFAVIIFACYKFVIQKFNMYKRNKIRLK